MWATIGIIVLLCLGLGISHFSDKDDSPAEQAVEAMLKTQGVDIDFSPDDKEESASRSD